jgi:hypothetical protein
LLQIEKVAAIYCLKDERVDFSEETKLVMDSEQVTRWLEANSDKLKQEFSFVTEIFFMTQFSLHIGLIKTISIYESLLQRLSRTQARKKEIEQSRATWL